MDEFAGFAELRKTKLWFLDKEDHIKWFSFDSKEKYTDFDKDIIYIKLKNGNILDMDCWGDGPETWRIAVMLVTPEWDEIKCYNVKLDDLEQVYDKLLELYILNETTIELAFLTVQCKFKTLINAIYYSIRNYFRND